MARPTLTDTANPISAWLILQKISSCQLPKRKWFAWFQIIAVSKLEWLRVVSLVFLSRRGWMVVSVEVPPDQTSPQRTVHLGEEFLHLIFPYILRHKLFWSAHKSYTVRGLQIITNPLGCLSIAIIHVAQSHKPTERFNKIFILFPGLWSPGLRP